MADTKETCDIRAQLKQLIETTSEQLGVAELDAWDRSVILYALVQHHHQALLDARTIVEMDRRNKNGDELFGYADGVWDLIVKIVGM